MPVLDPQGLIANRVEAIRAYHRAAGVPRAELDVSGGVDSAVMLGLLAQALRPENVTAVYSSINSSSESAARAQECSDKFGVSLIKLDLTETFQTIVGHFILGIGEAYGSAVLNQVWERFSTDPTIAGSLRSCLRAPIGRFANRLMGNGIRHGTGNEDEDRWLRFYQKGGDGEVDTNPIEMLSKGEVWQLAIALGVPKSIITAKPTPDLWGKGEAAHTDEAEIRKYLGFQDMLLPMYSVINPETGEYIQAGLIERVNRFLDLPGVEAHLFRGTSFNQDWLLGVEVDNNTLIFNQAFQSEQETHKSFNFNLSNLLWAVLKAERQSRHKINTNIPTLGTREELVAEGLLTNDLNNSNKRS